MSLPADINDRIVSATVRAEGAAAILHDMVHLGESNTVTTEAGELPSLAEWQRIHAAALGDVPALQATVTELEDFKEGVTSELPGQGTALLPYRGRTQHDRNQDRPHIFDWIPAGQHNTIKSHTSEYDATSDLHAAIAEVPVGGTICLPQVGTVNVTSVNVDKFGVQLAGDGAGLQFYTARIQGILDGVPVFNVTQPQFTMRGITVWGLSSTIEKGEDITQDCIRLTAPGVNNNLDVVLLNCGFAYFRDVVDMRGRNVRALGCLFSNSRRAVSIQNHGLSDVRGLELFNNRYHSMGKTGSSATSCVWVDPTANFSEVCIVGGEADDCVTLFNGFASNSKVSIPMPKARGHGAIVDATGHGLSSDRRFFDIDLQYQQANPTAVAATVLQATGTMHLTAKVVGVAAGGHGVIINAPFAKVSGRIESAGQFANNTYDAVQVGASAVGTQLDGLFVGQSTSSSPANKARYAINDLGTDTLYGAVEVIGAYGTGPFNKDATRYAGGSHPNRPIRVSYSWGSAMPTSGTYQAGSIHWRTNPAIAGTAGSQYVIHGWRRVTSGSNHVLNTDWVEMRMPTGT